MSIAERAAEYVRLTAPVVTLTQVVDGNLRDRYRATDELVTKTLEGHITYAAKVHNKCNGYLVRLRYGKRRNSHMQVREDLRKLRAEAAKLLSEKKEPTV